jgi:signal peptidase I
MPFFSRCTRLSLDSKAALGYQGVVQIERMNLLQVATPSPETAAPGPLQVQAPPSTGKARQIKLAVCLGLWSVISYLLISHFVLMSVEVKGTSMSPTLLNGDRYILFRCPYLWRSPRLGEIVVIKDPQDQDLDIKRVIALPNDLVEVRADGVYVNGAKLSEPYLASFATFASGVMPVKPTRLGRDDYFVLGDNRGNSADSRLYGPIPRKHILGLITGVGR